MFASKGVSVGSIVRLKDALYPYSSVPGGLGLVVDWMPPFTKTSEPYGLFRILWSGELEYLNRSDELSDDVWVSPEELDIVFSES
jgi:hypothetical protein